MRSRTTLLACTIALVVAAPASAAEPIPGALYEGTTDTGLPISFRVAADGQSVEDIVARAVLTCVGATREATAHSTTPFVVTEGTFSGADVDADPDLNVAATFTSRTEAEGVLDVVDGAALCSSQVTWTARASEPEPDPGPLPVNNDEGSGVPDPPPTPAPAPPPPGATTVVSLPARKSFDLRPSLKSGFAFAGTAPGTMIVKGTARLTRRAARRYGVPRRYDTATATPDEAGRFVLEFTPPARVARRLRKAKRLSLAVVVEATSADGSKSVRSRTVTLLR
jgi:hypothetical protein